MIGTRTFVPIVFLLFPSISRADDPTRAEDVLAQSLFDEATNLMKEGHFDEACPKLAESQRLEPGGGTLLNLGFCLEKVHKYASAYAAYNEALSAALRDARKDRETSAREGLATVTPLLSRLAVRVPAEARITGLDVRIDGTVVREVAWGLATPVDAGHHEVTATAPKKKPWKVDLEIAVDSGTTEVVVGPLDDTPPEPAIVPIPKTTEHKTDGRRTAAFIVLGVSGAALIEGIITGSAALAKHAERNSKCAMGCTPDAYSAEDQANAFAWAANIGIGAAIVGGVASVLLFVLAGDIRPPFLSSKARIVATMNGFVGSF
jgi:hypothetical protein